MNESQIPVPQLLNNVSLWYFMERSSNSLPRSNLIVIDSELTSLESFGFINFPVLSSIGQSVPLKDLDKIDYELKREAMKEEVDYMFKNNVLERVPRSSIGKDSEIQPLRWLLRIERSLDDKNKARHRSRLFSASNMFQLRHSLAGNSPTIAVRTVRLILTIAPI